VRAAGAKLRLLDDRRYGPFGEGVESFEDHIRYYADSRRVAPADFLDASAERVRAEAIGPVEGDLVYELCRRVRAAGSSAYAVDVTSPDVAELGLVVTKVIAPELCSLDVLHSARFLGGRRLYEAGGIAPSDVNPYPHPFP
jgi:ribosomal protein S12 methylthiotransferase accessory factor